MMAVTLSEDQFAQLLDKLQGTSGGSTGADGNGGITDSTSKSQTAKPNRPTVDVDTTEGEWAIIEDQWLRYKRMAKLSNLDEIRDNLRQCCAPTLNKRLFDLKGPATLNSASETDLLQWIKDTAVKGVHMEVHRNNFVQLKQKQGETNTIGLVDTETEACEMGKSNGEETAP